MLSVQNLLSQLDQAIGAIADELSELDTETAECRLERERLHALSQIYSRAVAVLGEAVPLCTPVPYIKRGEWEALEQKSTGKELARLVDSVVRRFGVSNPELTFAELADDVRNRHPDLAAFLDRASARKRDCRPRPAPHAQA
jgi:hypothetical protein